MKKFILSALALVCCAFAVFSQNIVVVGQASKLYDEPNMKYETTNRNNEPIEVLPGMVFRKTGGSAGWTTIEYVPGLRSYISDNALASKHSLPEAGTYNVENNKGEQVVISENNGAWTLASGGKTYAGKDIGGIVIFMDDFGNAAYSFTKAGGRPYLYSYSNEHTHFL